MKRAYKQKEMALERRIKTLEQQVDINKKLTNGIFTIFSSNQIIWTIKRNTKVV